MNFFRSHIIRITGVMSLLAGFVLLFTQPVNGKARHEAFANWLKSHVKTSDHTEVTDQINELATYDEELDSVIRKASQLVKNHSDDFELPLSDSGEAEDDVFQLLLTEWNNYQHASGGMARAILVEQGKTQSTLPGKSLDLAPKSAAGTEIDLEHSGYVTSVPGLQSRTYNITPLSGGIAIGAP